MAWTCCLCSCVHAAMLIRVKKGRYNVDRYWCCSELACRDKGSEGMQLEWHKFHDVPHKWIMCVLECTLWAQKTTSICILTTSIIHH